MTGTRRAWMGVAVAAVGVGHRLFVHPDPQRGQRFAHRMAERRRALHRMLLDAPIAADLTQGGRHTTTVVTVAGAVDADATAQAQARTITVAVAVSGDGPAAGASSFTVNGT